MPTFHDILFTTVGTLFGTSSKAVVIGPVRSGKTYFVAGTHRAYTLEERKHIGGRIAMELVPDNEATEELFKTSGNVLVHGAPGISATSDTIIYQFTLRITQPGPFGLENIYKQTFVIPDGPGGAVFNVSKLTESPMYPHIKSADVLILCIDTRDEASTLSYYNFITQISFQRNLRWKSIIFVATKADAIFKRKGDCVQSSAGRVIAKKIGYNQIVQLAKKCDNLVAGWVSFNGFQSNDDHNYRESDQLLEVCVDHGDDPSTAEHEWKPFQYLDPILYIATGNAFGLAPINMNTIMD